MGKVRVVLIGVVMAAFAMACGSVGVVLAHAEYVRSLPASGQTVTSAPSRVVIYFGQQLDMSMSSITVIGPSGEVVSLGSAKPLPDDRKAMYVDLKDGLGPGVYVVRWTNMSAEDGEHADGQFTFQIGGAAVLPGTGLGLPLDAALPVGAALISAGLGFAIAGRRNSSGQCLG